MTSYHADAVQAALANAHTYALDSPPGTGKMLFLDEAQIHLEQRPGSKSRPSSTTGYVLHAQPLDLGLHVELVEPDARDFLSAFRVGADEPERAHQLLAGSVSAALEGLRRVVARGQGWLFRPEARGIVLNDVSVSFSAGQLLSEAELAYWLWAVHGQVALRAVSPPSTLSDAARAFAALAKEHGLWYGATPLSLRESWRGIQCRALAQRISPLRYELELRARSEHSLRLGLHLTPAIDGVDRFALELAGVRSPLQFGDPEFEAAFALLSDDPTRARETFGDDARRRLVALRRFGPVEGNDQSLAVRSPSLLEHPEQVLPVLREIAEALAVLLGLGVPQERSAYR